MTRCKNCRCYLADEFADFCSDKCETKYLRTHKKKICTDCGRAFYATPANKHTQCSNCRYVPVYQEKKKTAPKEKTAPDVDEILKEQTRIYEETGRRLSYGQIMARRTRS